MEPEIADHLFPETGLAGCATWTATVVLEPHVRVSTAAASSVVQSNLLFVTGRADFGRPTGSVTVIHVGRFCRAKTGRPIMFDTSFDHGGCGVVGRSRGNLDEGPGSRKI